MGSCRGSCQLTRLKIYGLSAVLVREQSFPNSQHGAGEHSRHPNRHGGRCHAIQDVLDELIAGLHLCTRPVVWHLIRNDAL